MLRLYLLMALLTLGPVSCPVLAGDKLIGKNFPLGDADPAELKRLLEEAKTPAARYTLLPKSGTVFIRETAENMPLLEAIVREAGLPVPRVRVEITYSDSGSSADRGVTLNRHEGRNPSTRIRTGAVEVDVLGGDLDVRDKSAKTSSLASQFLLTRSGGTASIEVGEEVPFAEFFYYYARNLGYYSDQAPVQQVTWRPVGTRMIVQPVVNGNLITLRVWPEITGLTDDANAVISFRTLATEVDVAPGESVQIGGFAKADEEFNRNFFFKGRFSRSTGGSFTLRATIEPIKK
ncbi:MAG: hypothetical protein SFY92_05345 [Verrucomicrobiae bacterium]|nr:hypothetical protein [Verrucomicrobiae bacterium]